MDVAMSKKLQNLDYKDAYFLRRFLNSQGKMYPPKRHGLTNFSDFSFGAFLCYDFRCLPATLRVAIRAGST